MQPHVQPIHQEKYLRSVSPFLVSVLQINPKKESSVQPSTTYRSGTQIQRKRKEKQKSQLERVSQDTRNSETEGKNPKNLIPRLVERQIIYIRENLLKCRVLFRVSTLNRTIILGDNQKKTPIFISNKNIYPQSHL